MQAYNMPFTQLINVDQGAREHFHVPKYQREYSWNKYQWNQLIDDINDNEAGYFMGSIICVCDRKTFAVGDEYIFEVVDGQQRLTTLSILLMSLYTKLLEATKSYTPDDQQDRDDALKSLDNIKSKVVKRKKDAKPNEGGSFCIGANTYFLRVQPSAQNHNLADYIYLAGDIFKIGNKPKPPYWGNRLLARAYSHFLDCIPANVPDILSFLDKINRLMFVQITVDSHSDAFTLFESLNNRGTPLSPMDIIKNKMLAQMQRNYAVDIDDSFTRWQDIVEAVPDANDQERLLRHFYNTFKHLPEIKVDKAPRATRSVIIRIYETLISRNAPLLFDKLTRAAGVYGKLLRSDVQSRDIDAGLHELGRIGSVPAYLVLLYLFSIEESNFENPGFLFSVIDLLTRYFIRRNVTDTPPTRQIDQGFIDIVDACAARVGNGNKLEFTWFVEQMMRHARPATYDDFKSALEGNIYSHNTWMARYILIQIDRSHHSREYQPDFWVRDGKDRFVWTIEHVLPQAERMPVHWVNMIADGDKDQAEVIQERCVQRLGNLTLSGYNSDLATASFEKKQKLSKDRSFLGHTINIGYQNGLFLNSVEFDTNGGRYSLATAPKWDEEAIAARTMRLVDMVLRENKLPGE